MDEGRKLDAEVSEWIFGKPATMYDGELIHEYIEEEDAKSAGSIGAMPRVSHANVPRYSSTKEGAELIEVRINEMGLWPHYIRSVARVVLKDTFNPEAGFTDEVVQAAKLATPEQRAEAAVQMMKARHETSK